MEPEVRLLHLLAGRHYGKESACGSKIDYQSEGSAAGAAKVMTRKAAERDGDGAKVLEPYPCYWCSGWHIGRAMPREELLAVAREAIHAEWGPEGSRDG